MLIIDENVNSAALFAELQQKDSGGVSFNTMRKQMIIKVEER